MTTISIIIALIVAGMVLLLLEILTPTFGILIAMGIAALAASVVLCFRESFVAGVVLLLALVVAMPVYLVVLVKWLPKSPLGKRLFLRRAKEPGTGVPEAAEHEALVGKTGVAETLLRPSGAVRIEGRRVIASAESGMVQKGQRIKAIRAEGMNLIVRLDEPES